MRKKQVCTYIQYIWLYVYTHIYIYVYIYYISNIYNYIYTHTPAGAVNHQTLSSKKKIKRNHRGPAKSATSTDGSPLAMKIHKSRSSLDSKNKASLIHTTKTHTHPKRKRLEPENTKFSPTPHPFWEKAKYSTNQHFFLVFLGFHVWFRGCSTFVPWHTCESEKMKL